MKRPLIYAAAALTILGASSYELYHIWDTTAGPRPFMPCVMTPTHVSDCKVTEILHMSAKTNTLIEHNDFTGRGVQ